MKYVRASHSSAPYLRVCAVLLAGLSMAHGVAQAGPQWKWRDATGAIQYSDRPPPAGTPEANILSRPSGIRPATPRVVTAQPASQASAPVAAASASAPKAEDAELEARRKKLAAEDAAKRKAEEEKLARQKADNCQRARGYQRSLQDGIRIVRSNAQGEREVLDDKGRAEEMQRTQESIQANCN